MAIEKQITGVVLAGGLARRMNLQDKGLQSYQGQALVSYSLNAMSGIVSELYINANRNLEQYQQFGYPVITDLDNDFAGPLAGILAAMQSSIQPYLLVMPCDTPLVTTAMLKRLIASFSAEDQIAVADDGERLHPVLMLVKTDLQSHLQNYLQTGERKMQNWLWQHRVRKVDFSDVKQQLININELSQLQR